MKKLLNEWRKFLNENEGEDYYIRTWAAIPSEDPAGEQRYSVKMSNGEEFVAEFGEDLDVKHSKSGEPAKEGIFDMVVKFIIEDLPYEWDGRAQDNDPEGFKRDMEMKDSEILQLHYQHIKKKAAGDAGKQMGLPNVSEIRLGANTPQELGVITDELVDLFYDPDEEMDQEKLFGQLKDYFASVASKNEMDVDSLIDLLIDKGYSSQLDGLLYDPKFRQDLKERCEKGYKTHPTTKTKKMYGKTYRNCVKAEE